MPLEPCACAGLTSPPQPLAAPARSRRKTRIEALFTTLLSLASLAPLTLAQCGAWEDEPPPATAAAAANAPTPPPGDTQEGPGAAFPIAPPGGPIAPPGGEGAAAADDEGRYVSGEYAIGTETDSYDDNDPSALSDFHAPLDPYGAWVDDATYGTVWVPSSSVVGADFQPYVTAGHWAYDDDYVWVSDYPWGWAPFHYGRWVSIEGRGWSWIPGREYRGAWVTWSVDDGYSYLGWAPMGPAFVWFGGVAVGWHGYWGPRWAYCPRGDVFAPRVGAHVVVGPRAVAIAGSMHPYVVANVRVAGPPPARFGYTAAQVPHATAAASVTHAQQFARPSTARTLGGSAPARFESAPAGNGTRPPLVTGGREAPGVSNVPRAAAGTSGAGRVQTAPAIAPRGAAGASRPTTTWHGGGAVHGGGGHHR
jgi:hypothetical protein